MAATVASIMPVKAPFQPAWQAPTTPARASANRCLALLKAALNYAWREQKVATNDAWQRVELFRDAAYQSMLRRTRQQLHQHIANTLCTSHPEIAGQMPEFVAHHWTEAGDAERAMKLMGRNAFLT